jgi:hypothetical protein
MLLCSPTCHTTGREMHFAFRGPHSERARAASCAQAYDFMLGAMQDDGAGAVLVHCAGGISRSSALVAAFLMRHRRWSLAQALACIRARHPAAAPNYSFIGQLLSLERSLAPGGGAAPDPAPLADADLTAAGHPSPCPSPRRGAGSAERWAEYAETPGTEGGARKRARAPAWAETPKAPWSGGRGAPEGMWAAFPGPSEEGQFAGRLASTGVEPSAASHAGGGSQGS